ncbi:hypothetical protein MPDQ_003142 [Monascus purpureus]|uniref:Uncharacterized protein n=1 Tax=Monascus purpureus TaxID=5098 RepID=A0A507QJE0_MONPU|nr:hypothetical protein MPDQ_003142 [Monascus purpureus]
MAIVHFTLNQAKNSNSPITIDNTEVVPAKMVKILAVYSSTISAALREHVTHAAAKGRRIGEALNEAIKAGESTVWALGGKSLLPFPVKQLKDQALEV